MFSFVSTDGVFRHIEKLLVPGHHAGDAGEDQHAAVGAEDRGSGRAAAGHRLAEHRSDAERVSGDARAGNYGEHIVVLKSGTAYYKIHLYERRDNNNNCRI